MKDKKHRNEPKIETLLEYANSIIATLREPFLVLDKNLRIITANRAFYVTFEVTEKDTISWPLPDLGNRQWNIPKLLTLLKKILPEKKVVKDYEIELKLEQIGQRVMNLNACQLRVPKKIAAIIAAEEEAAAAEEEEEEELILLAIEDITERKRLLEELKKSEERFHKAFATSRDTLFLVHKTKGDILDSNTAATELIGYSHEEFLKKKLWEIGLMKDIEEFQEVLSKLEKEGLIHYEDTAVKTKEGLSINTEAYLVNKAEVMQCNIRDITDRKEEEEELKKSQARFKVIFDATLDGMVLVDIETKQFFMFNKAICQMLGYTEEEITRLSIKDIHPEVDLPYVMEQFERQARGEIKLAVAIPVKRKDGSVFYADINTSQIILSKKKYLMGSFRDITERKIIQDELTEKMQDLERFSKFAVDRELKMEELEKKIKELEERLKGK